MSLTANSSTISRITAYKLLTTAVMPVIIPGYIRLVSNEQRVGEAQVVFELHTKQGASKPAAWLSVFGPLLGGLDARQLPHTQNAGFILLVWIGNATYAVTGGVGHFDLVKNLFIERRFGIVLAESLLTLSELRGLEQKDTSGLVNYISRVFRLGYNPRGDIDNLKRVLTNVRGTLSETNPQYDSIGRSILAGDALSVSGQKTFDEVLSFLISADELWRTGSRALRIPSLLHLKGRHDGKLIATLEQRLVDDITGFAMPSTGQLDPLENLFLDNLEVGYLPDRAIRFILRSGRARAECATHVDALAAARRLLRGVPIEHRKRLYDGMELTVAFEDGYEAKERLSYFVCGDVVYNNEVYFIVNGLWYRADADFAREMDAEIDNIAYFDPAQLGLIEWTGSFTKEDDYLNASSAFYVLHRRLVHIAEERGGIEFCDLLPKTLGPVVDLVHIKKACGAQLRALYAQGTVSAMLYAHSKEYRSKVHAADLSKGQCSLVPRAKRALRALESRPRRDLRVVFAIYDDLPTHKVTGICRTATDALKKTLTPFAKVDLLSRVSALRSLGYDVALTRIKPYP